MEQAMEKLAMEETLMEARHMEESETEGGSLNVTDLEEEHTSLADLLSSFEECDAKTLSEDGFGEHSHKSGIS